MGYSNRVLVRTPTAEHLTNALGIGQPRPRISWISETDQPDWVQHGYEMEITRSAEVHSTGFVPGRASVLVPWPGESLASRERASIRVRVWGPGTASPSTWSEPLHLETGLLTPDDWDATLIGADEEAGPLPLLRTEFVVRPGLAHARVYVTAHGVYELEMNGQRVGDDVLAPQWTSYQHRLLYRTHDVGHLLRPGVNAIGALLADGWYRGNLGWAGRRNIYGDDLGLLAQLELVYQDGTRETVATGPDWQWVPGPILASDLYDGERYDAQALPHRWSSPGADPSAWRPVRVRQLDRTVLAAPDSDPIRRTEHLRPQSIGRSPSGRVLLDFGQNIVGRLELTVTGPRGARIELHHAEVLEDGELCTRPLRSAQAHDAYVLRGNGPETWEPRFTLHGFRYVEVAGWPSADGMPPVDAIRAAVCHTDMVRTGTFTCSDDLVQRLHDNVVWSMRGNFTGVPTDCPQRDERLGWTGDIAVFAPTASFLYNCAGMLASWLRDLSADQEPDGKVPIFIPWVDVWHPGAHDGQAEPLMAGWGDAATMVPWTLYEQFADTELLRRQYPSAVAWVEACLANVEAGGLGDVAAQFGDWLDPSAPPDRPANGATDPALVVAAFLIHSLDLTARTATVLGHHTDAEHYRRTADRLRTRAIRRFFTPDGTAHRESQTTYALALVFDLLHDAHARSTAAERLVHLVRAGGHLIATGFVGTPLICDALTTAGFVEDAYLLLGQQTCPSWLYPVSMGATTIWERWDSILPSGRINPGEMTSFNHYALGSVADWLHRVVAGISPAAPGYQEVLIAPRPGGTLTSASATHDSPYGRIDVSWRIRGDMFHLEVTLPANVTGRISLPDGSPEIAAWSGKHVLSCPRRTTDLETASRALGSQR